MYTLPIPSYVSKTDVYDFAARVAGDFELRPGGSIAELVSQLGGSIQFKTASEENTPDSIVVRDISDFTIFLSSLSSEVRDRFTVAHEVGHYLLHYPLVRKNDPNAVMRATRWVDETDEALTRAEWEANWFAAGLLMPKDEVANFGIENDTSLIASHFGVSLTAAQIRVANLG